MNLGEQVNFIMSNEQHFSSDEQKANANKVLSMKALGEINNSLNDD